ncbi:MAG: SMC-Scp complex subunit ScpB [Pirellulales bacterium]|nr:SMC-Scp complex subunit ScpB [Pirellulales bacterium]
MARVEAVLFLAKETLSSRKIAQLASLADGTQARTLIRRLNQFYDESGAAFRAEEVAGGFQLVTRPKFGPWLRRMLQNSAEPRLSGPALETLTVVAYRQPILRAEVEAVRGVQCGEMLRQLLERDLIRITGRADDLGRPLMYGTTRHFLELFGLKSLDELPRATELRGGGLPSRESDANNNATSENNSGVGRVEGNLLNDRLSEEESVTTRIRPSTTHDEDIVEGTATALLEASRRASSIKAAKAADDEDLDEEDEDWDDDDDDDDDEDDEDEEDDDFVEEEWEEVDDDDDEEEDDDDEDDDDWEDDEDDDWDDDEEEDDFDEEG